MTENNDFSVTDSAFWHTNMDLYYGYQRGEVVEVEHEINKYWLASIKYSFKHLILLNWIGNYGEFWIDTSVQNYSGSCNAFDHSSYPKRISPPGYHLQTQLKSQFTLERPIKVLVKPSLYNPSNDPYAHIKTVDDLLKYEFGQEKNAFSDKTSTENSQSANLVMATCKTTIAFGQEDVDELEAAILNLTEYCSDSTYCSNSKIGNSINTSSEESNNCTKSETDLESQNSGAKLPIQGKPDFSKEPSSQKEFSSKTSINNDSELDHEVYVELCKAIQESSITKGRYVGVEENSQKVYYLKPKLFFELGGANHERVLVPGTLLEVCIPSEKSSSLELTHWFAIVIKNTGGRLKLRWFLCDEPKFKQGRLELKSCKSEYIREEEEEEEVYSNEGEESKAVTKTRLHAKDISFSMHFCNPCIHTVTHAISTKRPYKMPSKIYSFIESIKDTKTALEIESLQFRHVFDARRMNLDKERPIIDHLLSTARWTIPQYIDISFAVKDKNSQRGILLSTPKTTKLLKGFIKSELAAGVYEIHSEPLSDGGEVIKFVYPYDSSYCILPLDWANENKDCLSVSPSRNPTPIPPENPRLPKQDQLIKSESNEKHELTLISSSNEQGSLQINETKVSYEPVKVGPYNLLCEIARSNRPNHAIDSSTSENIQDFDEQEPSCWSHLIRANELNAPEFSCTLDISPRDEIESKFKVMDQLEVVHPSSDITICLGRIRKVSYPLLWIQISSDSYTLLPFNSTDIYPCGWCEINNYPLISLLPPRKRLTQSTQQDKKRKKIKSGDGIEIDNFRNDQKPAYEKEHFDLGALNDKQLDIDYILNEKSMYIRIYFNHKCFTGPSLSKGKICSLPQYVGPGPLRLVMEEVVTKVISVAYVPPRILNDLSSKSFEDLLIARNLTNTTPREFKAKYQKRVHRENIPVCLSLDDVALYCECVCEHLKCCYNLFGPNLYDGDDCPGHCRALTKSNKFMKRATYYREKARLGEFTNDNGSSKKSTCNNGTSSSKTSRPRYAGRDSSDSTSSSNSRSEQAISCAPSSPGDDLQMNELKENLRSVEELENEDDQEGEACRKLDQGDNHIFPNDVIPGVSIKESEHSELVEKILNSNEQTENIQNSMPLKESVEWCQEKEFDMFDGMDLRPCDWAVDDVAEHLQHCGLSSFAFHMMSEGVDGRALLLLDGAIIREHFHQQPKSEFSIQEVSKLCRFVEFLKSLA